MPAFIFTDIEGSTRLWEEHAGVMSAVLTRHNQILQDVVEHCGGQVVKSTGDGFLVLFEIGNPLECAIEMQITMQEERWPEEVGELRIRIGVHSGSYEPRGGDIYGPDVNRAARVMDAGWGGQILITDDVKIDYKLPEEASLKDLGAHLLKDLNDPQPLFGLVHPKLQQEFPPPRSLSSQPNNLPILPTAFIGRTEEIKAIGDLLRNNTCRLITLHGPGGIGKTRLSIQAGISFLKHYPFGAYFVPLAPMNNPGDIWTGIASAINLPIYEGKPPKEQVLNYLKQKDLLLVLDNFEHLQSGADLVNDLLENAPHVQVLVTSRTRLQLRKECVFEVDGLQFPTQVDAEVFENFEAVQLFTTLAQRADPNYQMTSADRPAIFEICRLMGGMPLGIELAAHWVRIISPQEIVSELAENIDILKTEMVDVPERHRSMRAMFDYSWKLLDENEKQVLRSLSIFRGGVSLAAAKQILSASLLVISSLVDKSLVKRNSLGRYEMHELIRQLAEEKLQADEEEHRNLLHKHAHYYLTRLAEREADLKGNDQINALNDLEADFENLRLAWNSAIENDHAQLVSAAVESLYWMLIYRNHHAVGKDLFEKARSKWSDPDANPSLFHRLQVRLMKDNKDPEAIYRQAVDSARAREEKSELAVALNLLGRYYGHDLHDEERGLEHLEEAGQLFEQLGDDFYLGHVLDDISFTHMYQNNEARISFAEKSLVVRERSGDLFGTAGVLGNLLIGFFWRGRFDLVEKLIKRALEIAEQTNDIRNIAWQKVYLCEIRAFEGKFDLAFQMITDAEKISRDLSDADLTMQVNINKATVIAMGFDDYQQAKQIMEDTLPLDAEFSMHTPNGLMTHGLIAAGLGELETLTKVAWFPYEAAKFVDTGLFGLSWFSPLIAVALYYKKEYQAAVECIGFTREKGIITYGMLEDWSVLQKIRQEMKEILGQDAYQHALEQGKTMGFEDFRRYLEE
jgi:predicted ATPase/class 3 adenylate cyclase